MTRAVIACSLAVAVVLPAGALAAKPIDKRNAAKECKAERGTEPATQEAFAVKYGQNANDRDAFGRCVSQKTREEAAERKAAKSTASKRCKAEGKRGRALGKCVSSEAKKIQKQQDAADREAIDESKNAARECFAERGDTAESRAAFEEKYRTNKDQGQGKGQGNAFGKCVSSKTRES
jgi:hypothetical protein